MARALFSLDTFNVSLVNLIITMATPHARPVAYSDTLLYSFYQSVDEVSDILTYLICKHWYGLFLTYVVWLHISVCLLIL